MNDFQWLHELLNVTQEHRMLHDKQDFGTFSDVKENYQIKQIIITIIIIFFFFFFVIKLKRLDRLHDSRLKQYKGC